MSFIKVCENCPSNTNQRGFTSSPLEVSNCNAIHTVSTVTQCQGGSCGAEHQLIHLCFTAMLVAYHQQENAAWQDTNCNPGPRSYHSQKAEKMEMRVSPSRGLSSWAYSSVNTFIPVKPSQTIKTEFKVEFQVREKRNYNQKWARQYRPRLVGDGGVPLLLLIYTLL